MKTKQIENAFTKASTLLHSFYSHLVIKNLKDLIIPQD